MFFLLSTEPLSAHAVQVYLLHPRWDMVTRTQSGFYPKHKASANYKYMIVEYISVA